MLPLLDIFMVVLFVFATIQEQKLDTSVHEVEALSAQLETAKDEVEPSSPNPKQIQTLESELAELREEIQEYEEACGPRAPGDPVCPAAKPDGKELAERKALQDRLLADVAVFEIELSGLEDPNGPHHNRCCFRADPPGGTWVSCGELPRDDLGRQDWWDNGADGLIEGIRNTKDGFALVFLRQDKGASSQATGELSKLFRERMPSHKIYDAGVTLDSSPLNCPEFSTPP